MHSYIAIPNKNSNIRSGENLKEKKYHLKLQIRGKGCFVRIKFRYVHKLQLNVGLVLEKLTVS